MSQIASFVRVAGCVGFAVMLASACGGQSFEPDGGGGSGPTSQAGSGASAGKPPGGAAGSASAGTASGGSGAAGSGAGGRASAGAASGGSGTGGAAPFDEACDAPPVVGPCDALFPRWYNDPGTGICRPFTYGGCGANKNNYDTLAACQKACPDDGPPQFDSCQAATDCVVTGTGCCGVCDGPGITVHDLIAFNKKYSGALSCGLLPLAADPAGSGAALPAKPIIACAPCLAPPPGQGSLNYFVPDCVRGQCVVADVRTSLLTACKVDADCRVRHGNACCEGCSNNDLLAVRSDGSFEKLVCGSVPQACAACAPPASGAVAVCGAGGHCELRYAVP